MLIQVNVSVLLRGVLFYLDNCGSSQPLVHIAAAKLCGPAGSTHFNLNVCRVQNNILLFDDLISSVRAFRWCIQTHIQMLSAVKLLMPMRSLSFFKTRKWSGHCQWTSPLHWEFYPRNVDMGKIYCEHLMYEIWKFSTCNKTSHYVCTVLKAAWQHNMHCRFVKICLKNDMWYV